MKKTFLSWFFLLPVIICANEVIEQEGDCSINWTRNYLECTAISASAQNEYSAKLSAELLSRSKLLEYSSKIQINSERTLGSFMNSSHVVSQKISGTITGSRIIKSEYNPNNGTAAATTRVLLGSDILSSILEAGEILLAQKNLRKPYTFFATTLTASSAFYDYEIETLIKLYNNFKEKSFPEEVMAYLNSIIKNKDSQNTGIIIDASHISNFQPVVMPNIRDSDGKIIYAQNIVSKKTLTEKNGIISYVFTVEDGIKHPRVFENPIVIKAVDVFNNRNGDLVVTSESANLLKNFYSIFLEKCNIVIALGEW